MLQALIFGHRGTAWATKRDINKDNEKFYEIWERFKDLILKCLHHSLETWKYVQCFYKELTQTNCSIIESINGGGLLSLTDDGVYKVF